MSKDEQIAKLTAELQRGAKRRAGGARKRRREDRQRRIDADVAIVQSYRAMAKPWEQRMLTKAIDALRAGHPCPECAPMSMAIAQMDEAIDRELELARDILRKHRGRV